jgi:hypothetical protein
MLLAIYIAIPAITGLLFCVLAWRAFDWDRTVWGYLHSVFAVIAFLVAVVVGVIGYALSSYELLSGEELAADVQLRKQEGGGYTAMVTYPSKRFQVYDLTGDQWRVEARLIRWEGAPRLPGLEAFYRLERLSVRSKSAAPDAQPAELPLPPPDRLDLWKMIDSMKVPGLGAVNVTANFLPVADGASFGVSISPAGIVARPKNAEAITLTVPPPPPPPAPVEPAPEPAPAPAAPAKGAPAKPPAKK